MSDRSVPTTVIEGKRWYVLGQFDSKVLFRAQCITKEKNRVSDPSGHRMDQAVAEGSVKCRPKRFDIA